MIFITGDTHGKLDIRKLSNKNFKRGKELTRDDYVIISGDFGFIWNSSKEEAYWLKCLAGKKYTILFVDGNHENFEMLNNYPIEEWNGGKVHKIAENIIHLMRGQVFNIDGKKIFTFGGATSIDKIGRKEFIEWWSQELPTTAELNEGIDNLEKNNWEVDYVISHCCSAETLKTVSAFGGFKHNYEPDILNKYFDYIEANLKYKHWYFGHYHLDINYVEDKKTAIFQKIICADENEQELLIWNKPKNRSLCVLKSDLNCRAGGKVFWWDSPQTGDEEWDNKWVRVYTSDTEPIPFLRCHKDRINKVKESQTELLYHRDRYIKTEFIHLLSEKGGDDK